MSLAPVASTAPARPRPPVLAVAMVAGLVALSFTILTARAAHGASLSVTIDNFAFSPANLTVSVGDTVVWTNKQVGVPHTVTGTSGPVMLNSKTLNTGDTFSFTFTTPGTYKYYCAVHPDMVGTITVVSAPGGGGTPATTAPPTTTMSGMGGTTGSAGSGTCTNQSLVTAMLSPLVVHLDHAHLEESVGQQATDLINVNQYVLTHTVLVENMLNPLFNLLLAAPNGITPLLVHLDHAHLGESVGQQAADLINVNQYVLTHTVLVENMLGPTLQSVDGSYGC